MGSWGERSEPAHICGPRTLQYCHLAAIQVEAVENHTPEVIIIDEIGTEAECLAARTIAQRGG